MTPTVTGGAIVAIVVGVVLMHLDRRTLVACAAAAAIAVLLAYTDFPPSPAGSTPVATQSGVQ
jgi:CBS-domain-containing membrane protein